MPAIHSEKHIIRLQRQFRSKKRIKEEEQRLQDRHVISLEQAQALIAEGNQPYIPQCDLELAKRIMNAVEKVELFKTVTHFTAASGIKSIFNESLYGQSTLVKMGISFVPNALQHGDILQGDGNVVCLGAKYVHRIQWGSELTFDVKKLTMNNPCVFYKQRDFGFERFNRRNITIGNFKFCFSHTGAFCEPRASRFHTMMHVFETEKSNSAYAFSSLKNDVLISYNTKKMHQILTLNFFRFIDSLQDKDPQNNTKAIIYKELQKLDEPTLVKTLQEIGKQCSDTMEFNFYGAYKIDFSALLTIKRPAVRNEGWQSYIFTYSKPAYTLNLPDFIEMLKKGNVKKLEEVKKELPYIFNSYRFIDYLLDQIIPKKPSENNKTCSFFCGNDNSRALTKVIIALTTLREKCTLPVFMSTDSVDEQKSLGKLN